MKQFINPFFQNLNSPKDFFFKRKMLNIFFRNFLKRKKMHFSLIPLKSLKSRASKRRYAIVDDAGRPVAPSSGIFEETQNKIDNKLLVFEPVTGEPTPSLGKKGRKKK